MVHFRRLGGDSQTALRVREKFNSYAWLKLR
jgi:hypothetical protein